MAIHSKIKQVCLFITSLFSSMPGTHNIAITQGNESQAVVEFSPYQKSPLEKKKVDSRNATIDQGTL
jgi:regulator of nonsense transcripts 3